MAQAQPNTGTTTTTTSSVPPPQQQNVPSGYNTTQDIIFRKEFEKSVEWIDKRIANTNYMIGIILAVLAVGFITLLITVYGIVIQNSQFYSNAVQDLKNENAGLKDQLMNKKMDFMQKEIDELKVTPTPFGKG